LVIYGREMKKGGSTVGEEEEELVSEGGRGKGKT